MTDLSGKFAVTNDKIDQGNAAILQALLVLRNEQSQNANALATLLAQQHNALMTLLAQTNTKLDAVVTAIEALDPAAGGTGQQIVQELKDIHLDTQSIDLKLLRIRDAISPLGEEFPTGTRTSILWNTYRLMMAINSAILTGSAGSIASLMQAMLSSVIPPLNNISTKASEISTNIGQNAGDATTTALGYLSSIQFSNSSINAAIGPLGPTELTVRQLLAQQAQGSDCGCTTAPPAPDSCTNQYVSIDMFFVPSGAIPSVTNTVYVVWPSPAPQGLMFGDVFFPGMNDNSGLKPIDGNTWDGYSLYVQSSASTYSTAFTSVSRYPTGVWRPLSGTDEIFVIVPGTESVTAYLCLSGFNPNECVVVQSEMVEIAPRDGTKTAAHMAPPPPGKMGTANVSILPFTPGYVLSEPAVWVGDYNGWSFQHLIGADAIFVSVQRPNGQDSIVLIVDPNEARTITEPTVNVWVTRSVLVGAADGPFSVRACPPNAPA